MHLTTYTIHSISFIHHTPYIIHRTPYTLHHTPCIRYIIIGAQKGGTTSLYDYLSQHPLVCKGKRRETHFFDWRWDGDGDGGGVKGDGHGYDIIGSRTEEDVKRVRQVYVDTYYYAKDLQQYPSISTGESTPSYLFHYDIVLPRLKRYVYIHIQTQLYTLTYQDTHIKFTFTYTHTHVHTFKHIRSHICIHIRIHTSTQSHALPI